MRYLLFVLIFISGLFSVQAQDTVANCPGALASRLVIGQQGRVTPGDANNVRSEPTGDSALLGQIPGGGVFTVLQGPVCGDQRAWWQVDYNGLVGWTVEGAGDTYWVEPIVSVGNSSNRISVENLMHLTPRDPRFNNIRDAAWSADGRWFAVIDDDGLWLRDEQSGSDARLLVKRNQNGGIGSLIYPSCG